MFLVNHSSLAPDATHSAERPMLWRDRRRAVPGRRPSRHRRPVARLPPPNRRAGDVVSAARIWRKDMPARSDIAVLASRVVVGHIANIGPE